MNKFEFLGRLTKAPEIRVTNNNTKVVTITLAVNRRFVGQEKEKETDFFNLIAFGKVGEFIDKYFVKGQQILVCGRIQNRTWQDQNGQKRYTTDFIIEETYFADSKKQTDEKAETTDDWITVEETEELPF